MAWGQSLGLQGASSAHTLAFSLACQQEPSHPANPAGGVASVQVTDTSISCYDAASPAPVVNSQVALRPISAPLPAPLPVPVPGMAAALRFDGIHA